MKYYLIVEPTDDYMTPVYTILSEQEIIEQYFESWALRMYAKGLHSRVNRSNCIAEWVMVHWAREL